MATLPLHLRVREGIRHPGNWLQLGRYGVVGAMGYVVNNVVFALCVHVLDIHFRIAAVLAFLVSVTHNFIWNRHWTFDARDGHAGFQAARFFAVSIAAFLFAASILELLVTVASVPSVAAQAISLVAATPLNFIGNKMWSFSIALERD
jgi:putative flippase GtrA